MQGTVLGPVSCDKTLTSDDVVTGDAKLDAMAVRTPNPAAPGVPQGQVEVCRTNLRRNQPNTVCRLYDRSRFTFYMNASYGVPQEQPHHGYTAPRKNDVTVGDPHLVRRLGRMGRR